MKKKLWKIWKGWLVISIPISIILLIISGCMLDSQSVLPRIVCFINAVWLMLLIISNDPYRNKEVSNVKKNKSNRSEIWKINRNK